jgi:Amt family ammonium transporter
MLAVGVFASLGVNSAGVDGLIFGSVTQLLKQPVSIAAVGAYTFVITLVIGKLIDITIGLRVGQPEEVVGLDISQHGERAYGGLIH